MYWKEKEEEEGEAKSIDLIPARKNVFYIKKHILCEDGKSIPEYILY